MSNTYVKTPEGHIAIRASRAEVNRLPNIISGLWSIVPATAALRKDARLNILVKTARILSDGRLGHL